MLDHSDVCREALRDRPVFAHRRCPNLRDILMKAKITYPPFDAGTQGKVILNAPQDCPKQGCRICTMMDHAETACCSVTNKYYPIQSRARNSSCADQNLIYLLTCHSCQKQYIGETKRSFRIRLKEHLADIKHMRDTPVSHHFNQNGHQSQRLTAKILEIIPKEADNQRGTIIRKRLEKSWIYRFQCLCPKGINKYIWHRRSTHTCLFRILFIYLLLVDHTANW